MKIGDFASYTFIDKKIMVNTCCIYEHCEAVTKEGMIMAIKGEIAYLKTIEGTIKVMKCQLVRKPQS